VRLAGGSNSWIDYTSIRRSGRAFVAAGSYNCSWSAPGTDDVARVDQAATRKEVGKDARTGIAKWRTIKTLTSV
jgi:hypothetical protein